VRLERRRTPRARSTSDPLSTLRRGARNILGRDLSETETEQFIKYLNILTKWQSVHRLLGSAQPGWIVERVFLDSLLFRRVLPPEARDILDAGSGAGIPGIPLKLVDSGLKLAMVESRQRRVSFLSTCVRELSLTETEVIGERLENVVGQSANRFDAVVARCAGNVGHLFGLGAHLVRPGGVVIASGPPKEYRLPAGRWITVPGVESGDTRRFAVFVNE
jgi:16S rRNA (guanine527-N7)-methyltransferase